MHISPVVLIYPFIAKEPSLESHLTFNCHASLVSFNLEQFPSLSLTFMTQMLLKITSQLLCSVFPNFDRRTFHHDEATTVAGLFWKRCSVLVASYQVVPAFVFFHY